LKTDTNHDTPQKIEQRRKLFATGTMKSELGKTIQIDNAATHKWRVMGTLIYQVTRKIMDKEESSAPNATRKDLANNIRHLLDANGNGIGTERKKELLCTVRSTGKDDPKPTITKSFWTQMKTLDWKFIHFQDQKKQSLLNDLQSPNTYISWSS